jgi:phosphate/sulfate permease
VEAAFVLAAVFNLLGPLLVGAAVRSTGEVSAVGIRPG